MAESEGASGSTLSKVNVPEPILPDSREIIRKIGLMFWSKDEAIAVGDLLRGTTPQVTTDEDGRLTLWKKASLVTDLSDRDTPVIVDYAKTLVHPESETPKQEPVQLPAHEWRYSSDRHARVIQDVALRAMRRIGIIGPTDYRHIVAKSGRRTKDKSGYFEDEIVGADIAEKHYLPYDQGGPNLVTTIAPPRHEATKDTSDTRSRKSLGHEIQHIIRALSNRNFWAGYEIEAENGGLKKVIKERREMIGGLKVASNEQGSEGTGDLFSTIVGYIEKTGARPSLEDILPTLENSLNEMCDKFKLGDTKPNRYLAAKIALVHHVQQLVSLGYGDVQALNLLALGTYGYTSLEKAPALISLGVITQDKLSHMQEVLGDVTSWLTAQN